MKRVKKKVVPYYGMPPKTATGIEQRIEIMILWINSFESLSCFLILFNP